MIFARRSAGRGTSVRRAPKGPDANRTGTIAVPGPTAGAPLPSKLAEYAEAVASLDDSRRRRFYEALAHNLTVCTRASWSDEQLSDAQKVDRMGWLNELQHRVTGKLLAAEPWPDEEFFEGVLRARTNECPPLRSHVGWAVKQSYEYAAAARPAV